MSAELLDQLREKYKRAAVNYSEKIFNIKELDVRINHLLSTRGSMEMFLKAEMEFFEKAMNIAKKKEGEIQKKKEASAKVDAILEKNNEKIKKYRECYFDPAASYEVRKMTGAVSDWFETSFPLIKYLFRGADIWKEISVIEAEVERYHIPAGRPITVYLKHFADEIRKIGTDKKENAERRLLQTIANSLYKLEVILIAELNKMTDFQKARIIQMSPAFEPKVREKWVNYREADALSGAISEIAEIIDDFRLRDLSVLGFKMVENNK